MKKVIYEVHKGGITMEEYVERLENSSISGSLRGSMSKDDLYDIICELDEVIDNFSSGNQYNDIVGELIKRLK